MQMTGTSGRARPKWSGDPDRAIADYSDAIRLDPEDAIAYSNRGDVYRSIHDCDRALADYNEAIRLDPRDAAAYNGRGVVYECKNDPARATADYNEAQRLDSSFR
jgi:tetratricopeptide (TPR) repeat protein